ncbi:hypothetical protein [Leptolyngbya sp. 7M]|nr:hypothetical protein [Leptolyngbya sp. 7M]
MAILHQPGIELVGVDLARAALGEEGMDGGGLPLAWIGFDQVLTG